MELNKEMEFPKEIFDEIIEGKTKILVPKESISGKIPPKRPAFFNPKARLNRDFSIIAYAAFLKKFEGPKTLLEGLAGIGARGLRASNESGIERLVINDLNPTALKMAKHSAGSNGIQNVEFSENEVCRFLSRYSEKGKRGTIVDIDPFGSPAAFFDCGIRATMHGGMLSVTATDLQVLNGLFQNACKRRYGGVPARTEYGNEIAIRLVLGCLRAVSARLGVRIEPVFVESDMHYYRAYVKVYSKPDQEENIGHILHCKNCGHRKTSLERQSVCELCKSKISIAGPLWIGKIFDKEFVKDMLDEISGLNVDKICKKTIGKNLAEADLPATYYTLDEIASKTRSSPPKLENLVGQLEKNDFVAGPTAFSPTGFRTSANVEEIKRIFQSI